LNKCIGGNSFPLNSSKKGEQSSLKKSCCCPFESVAFPNAFNDPPNLVGDRGIENEGAFLTPHHVKDNHIHIIGVPSGDILKE